MFLGMPGLNGDSYPASQVRRPSSSLLFHCCVHDGVGGRVYVRLHTAASQGSSAVVLPSLGGFWDRAQIRRRYLTDSFLC